MCSALLWFNQIRMNFENCEFVALALSVLTFQLASPWTHYKGNQTHPYRRRFTSTTAKRSPSYIIKC
ncbi:hypothetical protein EG68_02785 [Paragonimus skrjabini miyazakii]|uniref:Uncharacterized protein n=1 Tax=Paragonimus skrjabini miyazakii TaxID=59628 RepID=A0A8S9Z3B9_9TREM|nr:hypothetical protein EG68_02785 [Paragonimus skrjabini miyazakii]